MGYGDSQALIAFHYNTPNNSLPVIWASGRGWSPLLPRYESASARQLTQTERLALTYLYGVGGSASIADLRGLNGGQGLGEAMKGLLAAHYVKEVGDDDEEYLELRPKGTIEIHRLLDDSPDSFREHLRECALHLRSLLGGNPRSSPDTLASTLSKRQQVVSMVYAACEAEEFDAVVALRELASWILARNQGWNERIRLGSTVLRRFHELEHSVELGRTRIDDLGWSNVALKNYEVAEREIGVGLTQLWKVQDAVGLCQGWRHNQAIRNRRGHVLESILGLRAVFGAACAIESEDARLEMQVGTARGLGRIVQSVAVGANEQRFAELTNQLVGQGAPVAMGGYHAPTSLSTSTNERAPGQTTTLLLVRHVSTVKNSQNVFGRISTLLAAEADAEVRHIQAAVRSYVTGRPTGTRVFSAPADGAIAVAESLARTLNWDLQIEPALDSIESGRFSGLTEEIVQRRFPAIMTRIRAYRRGTADGFSIEFPGGETVRSLSLRVARFLIEKVITFPMPQLTVVVGHTSSLTALLNILTALDRNPPSGEYRYFDIPVASLTEISVDPVSGLASVRRIAEA
ncbi:MAG: histidine phosphatase family protein [Gammaproteobacteria bacterium]